MTDAKIKIGSCHHGKEVTQQDHHRMFHYLWSACVGTKDYDKEAWKRMAIQLERAEIIKPT